MKGLCDMLGSMKSSFLVLMMCSGLLFVPSSYAQKTSVSSEMQEALSKEPRDSETLVQKGKMFFDPKDSKPYSGRIFIHVSLSGKRIVDHRGLLLRGKLEGLWRGFHDGGIPKSHSVFKGGKRHGPHTSWRKDGSKNYEVLYEHDQMNGLFQSWGPAGKPLYRMQFKKGSGVAVYFHPNGKKYLETPYVEGREHGIQRFWRPDGVLDSETRYEKGEQHGKSTLFDFDGGRIEMNFRQDKKHGRTTRWDAKGRKINEVYYQNGQQHGVETHWDSEGAKSRESHHHHGQQHGIERFIGVHPDGLMGMWTCQWKQGVKGKCRFEQGKETLD